MYNGVGLDNICLLNQEVEACSACGSETPILRGIGKLHNAIGVAVALQKVHLSGADIRFLRRSAGFSVGDWAKRLNVAEGTYSKWENGHRSITAQADKLARINYINVLKQKDPDNVWLAHYLNAVLDLQIERRTNFIIGIDAEKPEAEAKYLPDTSPLFAAPEMSVIEAQTLASEPLAKVIIVRGYSSAMPVVFDQELAPCG